MRYAVVLLLVLAIGGVSAWFRWGGWQPAPAVAQFSPQPDEASAERVHAFCGSCHAYPPPDSFPRSAWREEVRKAFDIFRDTNLRQEAPDLEAVVRYYEQRAPLEFPTKIGAPVSADPPVKFTRQGLGPPQGPPVPRVTNLQLAHLFRKDKLDLIVCHMNPGRIWAVSLYENAPTWHLLCDSLIAPCHVEAIDLDGDGHMDLVVAELGSFLPTNHRTGQVVWLRGDGKGGFTPHVLAEGIGRVADVQVADFTGDGKLDLVVAVFGWRKGEIILLEQQTADGSMPKFTPRVLDDRAGAIHVPVADLNGDAKPDFVALISQEHEIVVAFLNEGAGKFTKKTIYEAPHPAYESSGIQLVDLNGDGALDVLYTNGDVLNPPYLLKPYHAIRWLENRGSFPFVHHEVAPMYGVMRAIAADFAGNGKPGIVAVSNLPADMYTGLNELRPPAVLFLEQTAPGVFTRHTLETTSCNHVACVAGDVHGDGRQWFVTGNFYLAPTSKTSNSRDLVTVWQPPTKPAKVGAK